MLGMNRRIRSYAPVGITDRVLWVGAVLAIGLAIMSVAARVASAHRRAGYVAGDKFDRTVVGPQTAGRPMVVIWLSTSCGACIDSVDFYRRLTSMPRRPNVAVLSPGPVNDVQQFLQEHAIRPDLVASTNGNWMKFRGTPTILLLDADSTVKQIWFGRLQDAGDELNLIFALAQ